MASRLARHVCWRAGVHVNLLDPISPSLSTQPNQTPCMSCGHASDTDMGGHLPHHLTGVHESQAPQGMGHPDALGSAVVAEIAMLARPRYHFAGGSRGAEEGGGG